MGMLFCRTNPLSGGIVRLACCTMLLVCLVLQIVHAGNGDMPPLVLPTDADRALLDTLQDIVEQGIEPRGMLESYNLSRTPQGREMRDILLADEPVAADVLGQARWFYRSLAERLAMQRDWPAPVVTEAVYTSDVLSMDGIMDEAAWQTAPAVPVHYPNNQREPAADAGETVCRVLWNDTHLFIGFAVKDADVMSPFTERNQPISQADCVEVFLLAHDRLGLYWELNVSPAGVVFDALMLKHPDIWFGHSDATRNLPGLEIGASVQGTLNDSSDIDRGYVVEIAIPFTSFLPYTERPAPGDTISVLFARADRNEHATEGPLRYYSHSPIAAWFHNIWGYAPLVFTKD